jgi:hypothetical protein
MAGEWELHDAQWEKMFAALVGYKEKYGHCNVPRGWPENPKLANWVTTQRRRRKANRLSKERIRRLDELGFVWNPLKPTWEERFASLVAYREEFGHCNVPRRWPANPKLSTWVRTRRRTRTANKLSEDRS